MPRLTDLPYPSQSSIIKDGTLIQCSSLLTARALFLYPFRYFIQILPGSRIEHSLTCFDNKAIEERFRGIIIQPIFSWLNNLEPQIKIYAYSLKTNLTKKQVAIALAYIDEIKNAQKDGLYKYSVVRYAFSKIPFLKKIKFREDKYLFCNDLYLRILQKLDLLPSYIDTTRYTPDSIIDLLTDYNLINGREVIK